MNHILFSYFDSNGHFCNVKQLLNIHFNNTHFAFESTYCCIFITGLIENNDVSGKGSVSISNKETKMVNNRLKTIALDQVLGEGSRNRFRLCRLIVC